MRISVASSTQNIRKCKYKISNWCYFIESVISLHKEYYPVQKKTAINEDDIISHHTNVQGHIILLVRESHAILWEHLHLVLI